MATFFGYEFKKAKAKELESFAPASNDDGSIVYTNFGSHISYAVDLDLNNLRDEGDLIQRYREISFYSEVDAGIDEIVNESIVYDDQEQSIKVDFVDDFNKKYSESTKKVIVEEFNNILRLLNFGTAGSEIFRRWYIDGRYPIHKIVDEKKLKDGIKEIRWIDPVKIRKIVEYKKTKSQTSGLEVIVDKNEYFIYNEKGFKQGERQGVKIAKDAVTWHTSGLVDATTGQVYSYLHKAIRPTNQLRMMEDASIIYTLSRAPERRIFYIDTGDLPRSKAEEYIKQVMARYRNKQVYDAATGKIKDDKKHMSMLEDFWLPRTNGKGTEVTTLPSSGQLITVDMIELFKNKLFQSLNVPLSRLQPQQTFNLGRANEVTRDEIKFAKFVGKLRKRFNFLFLDLLRTQLILKGITTSEEWDEIKEYLVFNYVQDNQYQELKETEIMRERLQTIQQMTPYIGQLFSLQYINKKILQLTDDEIKEMQSQIAKEPKPDPEAQQ